MKKKNFSNNALLSIRTRLKLTQEQMSIKLGISKSMVKLVETNRRSLSVLSLLTLAEIEIELTKLSRDKPASQVDEIDK